MQKKTDEASKDSNAMPRNIRLPGILMTAWPKHTWQPDRKSSPSRIYGKSLAVNSDNKNGTENLRKLKAGK
jgi:hypothetical protein